MAGWVPPIWRFESFYSPEIADGKCLYVIQPRHEPEPRRCFWESSDIDRAAELRQAILAADEVELLHLESYILCLCCMSGNAKHAHRIQNARVLRPLAEHWLGEINAQREAERAEPPSQSAPAAAFPSHLLVERIASDAIFIPFITNPDPSECVAKKMLQPIGTNEYETRTGSVYGFSRERWPGFVKIGFTSGDVRNRLSQWANCGYDPELLFQVDDVPNARRAEWLTHYELRNEWRQERWCEKCLGPHQEWFEVSAEKAEKVVRDWASFLIKAQPYEANGSIKPWWKAAVSSLELKGKEVTAQNLLQVYDAKVAPYLEEKARQTDDKEQPHVADNEDRDGEVKEEEEDEEKLAADAASLSVADSATPEVKKLLRQSVEVAERSERLEGKFTPLGLAGNGTSVSSISLEPSLSDDEAKSSSPTSVAPPPPARVFKFEPIELSAFQPIPFQVSKLLGSQSREQSSLSHTPAGSEPSTARVLPPTTNVFKFELPAQSNGAKSVPSQLPADNQLAASTTPDTAKSKEARDDEAARTGSPSPEAPSTQSVPSSVAKSATSKRTNLFKFEPTDAAPRSSFSFTSAGFKSFATSKDDQSSSTFKFTSASANAATLSTAEAAQPPLLNPTAEWSFNLGSTSFKGEEKGFEKEGKPKTPEKPPHSAFLFTGGDAVPKFNFAYDPGTSFNFNPLLPKASKAEEPKLQSGHTLLSQSAFGVDSTTKADYFNLGARRPFDISRTPSQNRDPTTADGPASSAFNFADIFKTLPQAKENLSPDQIPLPPSPILLPAAVSNDEEGEVDRFVESNGNHVLPDFSQEEPRDLGSDLDPSQDGDDRSETGEDDDEEEEEEEERVNEEGHCHEEEHDDEQEEEVDEEVTLVQGVSSCPESTGTKTKPAAEDWDGDTTLLDSQVVDPLVLKMTALAVASKPSAYVSVTTKSLLGNSSPTASTRIGDGLLPPVDIAAQ